MTRTRYGLAERDQLYVRRLSAKVEDLRNHERCYLYRRRLSLTQEQVAESMGVSRYWLNCMERGKASADKLIAFWESFGGI